MIADHYYGAVATGYERKRKGKPVWAREQQSVAEWVTEGPVLDCPVGTGRYLDVYRGKGLDYVGVDISPDMLAMARIAHPSAMLVEGTVFNLPWPDNHFAVAVCTRLLNWLYPRDMQRAITELRRVSRSLVVGIRTGSEGHVGRQVYTHSPKYWARAIEGLTVKDCRVMDKQPDSALEMWWLE